MPPEPSSGALGAPLRDTDGAPSPRVVSLSPAATDIVAALGLGAHLVGVSHECDHGVAAGLPVLTSSSLPSAAPGQRAPLPPAEVDRRVVESVAADEPLYQTDAQALAALRPDIVLAQEVCDVCAVPGRQVAAELPEATRLVVLGATSLDGLASDLRAVGRALAAEDRAEQQIQAIAAGHARVEEIVANRPRPRALALEWGDPPFLGGHWIPELVRVAGGHHVLTAPGQPSRRSTWDEIAATDPDAIVFMPCGYGIGAAVAESRELLERPEVARLRAVHAGRWWATDATRLFSRCTPAVVTAVPVLAAILHPEALPVPSPRRAAPVLP